MAAARTNPAFVIALLVSVAGHAGAAWWAGDMHVLRAGADRGALERTPSMVIRWADDEPDAGSRLTAEERPPVVPPLPDPPPSEPRELRLGIAQSPQETENWIGFADPTPHSAPLSEVDQPALDPNAGAPGTPGGVAAAAAGDPRPDRGQPSASAPAVPPPGPSVQAEARSESASPDTAEVRGEAREQIGAPGDIEQGPDDPARPLIVERVEPAARAIDERDAGFIGPPAALVGSTPAAEPTPPVPASSAVGETPAGRIAAKEGGSDRPGAVPGERSERESNAASREVSIEVRPGRPAAAEGLEIITRRPEFSRVTRLMAAPGRNPRLRVTFDREGLVRHAEFIEATGIRDVDDPVQHAVYRWRARGRALADLPAGDPRAGVTITVTILLR